MNSHQSCRDLSVLAELIRGGDDRAFDELFHSLYSPLVFFASKILNGHDHAEDIVQDVLMKYWQRRASLPTVTNIKSYLYVMVRNRCLDWLEKPANKQLPATENLLANAVDDQQIEQWLIQAETIREVIKAMEALPPRMQEVFRQYYLEEKTTREISELTQTSVKTISKQRENALKQIRERIIPNWKARFEK